jgi:hypothetical protein
MAQFVLTAQLQLQAPKNASQVLNQIQNQLKGVQIPVTVKSAAQATKQINQVTDATNKATSAAQAMGKSFGLAIKRFAAFTVASRAVSLFTNGLANAVDEAIDFQREVVKIAQVTGKTVKELKGLEQTITRLSVTLGTSSKELLSTARILSQAGIKAGDLKVAIDALAKTTLAPTFEDISKTAEGAVAILAQFEGGVGRLEKQLGSINAVAGAFAVESGDLISAVRRFGGVFKSAGGNLEELLALFTSVRATTRESSESIATGLRTIFTRIQRPKTIEFLRQFGVELLDAEGKFIGPLKAVEKLNKAFAGLEQGDITFVRIAEELGGFRQIGKVIPLIQQYGIAVDALNVAQAGQNSLSADAIKAQQALAVQITKVKEEFLALVRGIAGGDSFQLFARTALEVASALIKVADAIRPLIPLIGALAAFKFAKGLGSFAAGAGSAIKGLGKNQGGVIQKFARGGYVPGSGNGDTVPAMLTPGEFVIKKSSAQKLGAGTLKAMNNNKFAGGGLVVKQLHADDETNGFAGLFARPRGEDSSGTPISVAGNPKGKEGQQTLAITGSPKSYFIGNTDEAKFTNKADSVLRRGINEIVQGLNIDEKTANKADDNIIADIGVEDIAGKIFEGVTRAAIGDFREGEGSKQSFDVPKGLDKGKLKTLAQLFGSSVLPDINYDNKLTESRGNRASLLKKADTKNLPHTMVPLTKFQNQKTTKQLIALPGNDQRSASLTQRLKELKAAKEKLDNVGLDEATQTLVGSRLQTEIVKVSQAIPASYSSKKKKPQKAASGGSINGSGDTVPALLTPGEFVVNKKSAQSIGYGNLNSMNKSGVAKFAKGGAVQMLNGGGSAGGGGGGGFDLQTLFFLTAIAGTAAAAIEKFGDTSIEASDTTAKLTIGLGNAVKGLLQLLTIGAVTLQARKSIKAWGEATEESAAKSKDAEESAAKSKDADDAKEVKITAQVVSIEGEVSDTSDGPTSPDSGGSKSTFKDQRTPEEKLPAIQREEERLQKKSNKADERLEQKNTVVANSKKSVGRDEKEVAQFQERTSADKQKTEELQGQKSQLQARGTEIDLQASAKREQLFEAKKGKGEVFGAGIGGAEEQKSDADISKLTAELKELEAESEAVGEGISTVGDLLDVLGSQAEDNADRLSIAQTSLTNNTNKLETAQREASQAANNAEEANANLAPITKKRAELEREVAGAIDRTNKLVQDEASKKAKDEDSRGSLEKLGRSAGGAVATGASNVKTKAGELGKALQDKVSKKFDDTKKAAIGYAKTADKALRLDKARAAATKIATNAVNRFNNSNGKLARGTKAVGRFILGMGKDVKRAGKAIRGLGDRIKKLGGRARGALRGGGKLRKGLGAAGAGAASGLAAVAAIAAVGAQIADGFQQWFKRAEEQAKANDDIAGAIAASGDASRAGSIGELFTLQGAIQAASDPEGFGKRVEEKAQKAEFESAQSFIPIRQQASAQKIKDGGDTGQALSGVNEAFAKARSEAQDLTGPQREAATQSLDAATRTEISRLDGLGLSVVELRQQAASLAGQQPELLDSLNKQINTIEANRLAQEELNKANLDATKIVSAFGAAANASAQLVAGLQTGANSLALLSEELDNASGKLGVDSSDAINQAEAQLLSSLPANSPLAASLSGQADVAIATNQFGQNAASGLNNLELAKGADGKGQLEQALFDAIPDDADPATRKKLEAVIRKNVDGIEGDVGDADLDALTQQILQDGQELSKGFREAVKLQSQHNATMTKLYADREQLEQKAAAAANQAIETQLEAAKVFESFGGSKLTGEQKLGARISQFNNVGGLGGLGAELTTGSAADINAVAAQIGQTFADQTDQVIGGALAAGAGIQKGGPFQGAGGFAADKRPEAQAANKALIQFTKQRISLLKEELNIVKQKNAAEKSALDKLISGDVEGFLDQQAASGAGAALASGSAGLAGLFSASALGAGFKTLEGQGLSDQKLRGAEDLTLQRFGIQGTGVLSGTTTEQEALKSQGRELAASLGGLASQEAAFAKAEISIQDATINAAQLSFDRTLADAQRAQSAQGLARGGVVYANRGMFVPRGTDTVPAMLTPGEFVVNRAAVNRGNNLQILRSMNTGGGASAPGALSGGGSVRYYNDGGFVDGITEVFTNALPGLTNIFSGFAETVQKLVNTKFNVALDPTNINVNFNGASFLETLKDDIKDGLLTEVGNEIQKYKANNSGDLVKNDSIL